MKQNTKINIIAVLLILTLPTLIYSNSFYNSFQYDDERVLHYNSSIKDISNYTNLFNINHKDSNRPVLAFTFALNYHFGKFNVFGYHLLNLFTHLSVCLLIYFITKRIFYNTYNYQKNDKETLTYELLPLFTSILFAVHPINSQTVNYISARSASLCLLFMLVSLYLFIKFKDLTLLYKKNQQRVRFQVSKQSSNNYSPHFSNPVVYSIFSFLCFSGTIAAFLLALGVRKMAAVLPLILICFDFYFYNNKRIYNNTNNVSKGCYRKSNITIKYLYTLKLIINKLRLYHLPFWVIIILGFIILSKSNNFSLYVPLHVDIMTACKAYVYYLKLIFLPIDLSIHHQFSLATSIFDLTNIVSICIVIILISLIVFLYKRSKIISFSIIIYFVTPLITSSVLIITYSSVVSIIAEHRIYASCFGFCLSISVIIYYLSKYITKIEVVKTKYNKPYIIQCFLILPIITFYSITTFNRNREWKSGYTLWKSAVEHSPNNFKTHYNLGQEYTKMKAWDESIFHYVESIKYNNNYFHAHNNLAIAYGEKGKFEKAIKEFKIAIKLNENFSDTRFNLAIALEKNSDIESAINEYNIALKLKPDNIIAMLNLAKILLEKGELDKAESILKNTLRIAETTSFDNVESFYNTYKSTINEIIVKNKESVIVESLNNLGIIDMKKGNIDESIVMFNKALQINNNDGNLHYNLAQANSKKGLTAIAESEYKKAIKLKPSIAEAHNSLGVIYYGQARQEDAFREFKTAVTLKPNFANAHKNLGFIYMQNEDVKNGKIHLNETLRLDPNQEGALNIKLLLKELM